MAGRSWLGRAFLVIGAAAALYMGVGLIVGWDDIHERLHLFPPALWLPLLVLSLANYALRFWRWEIYRRRLSVPLRWSESLALFLATFAMVVTPGKLGEIYKAGYLWEKHTVPLSTGLPILIAERLFDLLAVLCLAAVGLPAWHGPLAGVRLNLIIAAAIPLTLFAMRSRRLQSAALVRAARAPLVRSHTVALHASLDNLQTLTAPALSGVCLALSIAAWGAECLSLWLVCAGLGAPIGVATAVFVYAAATLAGSLVFLPGGLGGTEGTLIFLLGGLGQSTEAAVSAALLVRLATLWLAVAIGLAVFVLARRLFLAPAQPQPAARDAA